MTSKLSSDHSPTTQRGPSARFLGRVRHLAACTIVAIMMAACSSPPAGSGLDEGGPVAFVPDHTEGGDDALLTGEMEVTSTCLIIHDDVGQTWLPVFQRPRTTWDGDTLTYSGRSYQSGSRISLGGGGIENTGDAYIPSDCEYDLAFMVGS